MKIYSPGSVLFVKVSELFCRSKSKEKWIDEGAEAIGRGRFGTGSDDWNRNAKGMDINR